MLKKTTHLIVFVCILATSALAQVKKGDKYYEKAQYIMAIHYYKKESKSNATAREEAMVKLGNSYKQINDYANAEKAYQEAAAINSNLPAEFFYNYAQVLKSRNKYQEATTNYETYISMSPNDEYAKNALKFCKEIQYYAAMPVEYKIKNIAEINTKNSEFSPFLLNDKLIYVAEREDFNFVDYTLNDYDGEPYLNMYVSNIKDSKFSKSHKFSKLTDSEFHDGPACINKENNTLYFTRVANDEKKPVNHARIYIASGHDRVWNDIKEFEYNSDEYSVAQPCISDDNSTLFFSSNMPGGFGGKDIWMCNREGETWGKPVNLGPDINTTGDEMYPSFRKDGVLFFSSTGLPGFGGLDIYSAINIDSKWILQKNEGLNINSNADDFGIAFLNDSAGYFSSNREGGKGRDDIYSYTYKSNSIFIDGTVLLTENLKDYAKMKKVILYDENGKAIDSTYTDAKGYFKFKNLSGDKKYMAVISEDDPELTGKARYYLAEGDSVITRVTGKFGKSRFAFKGLPLEANSLPDLYTDDDLVMAGNILYGKNSNEPLKNARIRLVNDFGDVVEETTTNEFGAFAFRNIPSQQNYLVSIVESDIELPEGTKVTLTNKTGKELKTFYTGKDKFNFKILGSDKATLDQMIAEDVNLSMDMYGFILDQDKKPIPNAKIRVKEADGSHEQVWTTTDKGKFNFKNLDAEKNYLFETDENDPNLNGVQRIYVADSRGLIYKVIDLSGGKFSFKLLDADKAALGEFVVDDPWLKTDKTKTGTGITKNTRKVKEIINAKGEVELVEVPEEESELSLTIVENIYYAYGDFKIDADAEKVMNKAVDVLKEHPKLILEISSHTDSQSSSGFNLGLSRKRAQTAVDYLVNKGIARNRLKATGYGETRLLNKCADGIECTEDEHKVNRRTEFTITKPKKK